jgi:tetratricopeptide (TPR) repeat protein
MRCGPEDSYAFVAAIFRCPDGTNPLGGSRQAAMLARRGNVGENRHHNSIIDVYEVPCVGGAEKVYVDMNACPDQPTRPLTGKGLRIREGLPADANKLMKEGLTLEGEGKTTEAIAKIKQALLIADKELDVEHPQRGTLLDLLGSLHQNADQQEEAELALASAYRIWSGAGWPPIPLIGNTCLRLAHLYAARKQPMLTACLAQRAVSYLEDIKGPFDGRIADALLLLGETLQEQGRFDPAEKMFKRAVRLIEMNRGRRDPKAVQALGTLAAFYTRRGDQSSRDALRRRLAPVRSSIPSK